MFSSVLVVVGSQVCMVSLNFLVLAHMCAWSLYMYCYWLTGVHGCLVSQNPSSHLSQLVATLDTSFVLSVRVPPSTGQPEVVSQALILDFLPAFYVHNAEVHLSTVSPLSSIRISSSAKVISDIQVRHTCGLTSHTCDHTCHLASQRHMTNLSCNTSDI